MYQQRHFCCLHYEHTHTQGMRRLKKILLKQNNIPIISILLIIFNIRTNTRYSDTTLTILYDSDHSITNLLEDLYYDCHYDVLQCTRYSCSNTYLFYIIYFL